MDIIKPFAVALAAFGLTVAPGAHAAAPGASAGQTQPPPAASTPAGKPTRFVEQGLDALSSPFTRPTVLKLNAIVARSKTSIDAFDKLAPVVRASVSAGAKPNATNAAKKPATLQMGRLMALAAKAATEQSAMKAAEKQVRASGEKYNDTLLSAMVGFVDEVTSEINEEVGQLSARLAARR